MGWDTEINVAAFAGSERRPAEQMKVLYRTAPESGGLHWTRNRGKGVCAPSPHSGGRYAEQHATQRYLKRTLLDR